MPKLTTISGSTRLLFLIGHPVVQVKTPEPINAWLAENDRDVAMVPVDIHDHAVRAFFDAVRAIDNCVGLSVTMPHKQMAFSLCDSVSPRAERAGAVNAIRREADGRLHGDMLDGQAMVAAMRAAGSVVTGKRVLLIGAGGAGGAIAHAIADGGCRSLTVLDLDADKQTFLANALRRHYPDVEIATEVADGSPIDIAINASPAGMHDSDPLPFPVERLSAAEIVADAVTKPAVTPWLAKAQAHGLKIQPGLEMALAQLPLQFEFWRL